MYLRAAHAELRIPILRQFIRDNPLGIFTTAISSPNYPLIQCSHIPWVLDVQDDTSDTELGKLRGHMARANPHSKAIIEDFSSSGKDTTDTSIPGNNQLKEEVMILFNAPVNHYVTPKFYVETKPATGKVVPTWNYAAVQAYGTATFYTDATSRTTEYLSKQISDLSNLAETNIMGHERPWQVSDAPERYVDLLRKSIIGVEIEITRLEGKFKMSQELAAGDRAGVIDGFKKIDTDAARFVADTVEERGRIKDEGKTMKTAQVAQ